MNQVDCTDIRRQLDDLIDGYLAPGADELVQQHLAGCDACARERDTRLSLRHALREMPVPEPRPGFARAALAAARAAQHQARAGVVRPVQLDGRRSARPNRPRPRSWFGVPVGLAATAALAAVLWLGFGIDKLPSPGEIAGNGFDGVRIALFQPQEIGLAIDSDSAVEAATITLRLEGDIELVGFAGERELSWQTELDAGTNLLSLPVLARSLSDGRLVARVEHGGETSEFSVRLRGKAR